MADVSRLLALDRSIIDHQQLVSHFDDAAMVRRTSGHELLHLHIVRHPAFRCVEIAARCRCLQAGARDGGGASRSAARTACTTAHHAWALSQ